MSVDIVPGAMRFIVAFDDEALTIPIVRTLIFLERRLSDSGDGLLIFEELHALKESEKTFVREADFDELVLDARGLLELLGRWFDGTAASYRG